MPFSLLPSLNLLQTADELTYFCLSAFFMNDFFKDKVVAVTGGSDGIGKALIDALIPFGAKIATCGRNQDKLYDLQVKYSNHLVHIVVCDVSRMEDCRYFIESTIQTFGGIDILINNAGISMRALMKEAEIEVFKKLMDVNFYGTVYCTKMALLSIIERKGTIVGISSIAGFRGLPGRSGYSASKFAVNGFLESIRVELIDTGVKILCVCPGFTTSNIRNTALDQVGNIQKENPMDESKMMSASDCAGYILKAIKNRKRTLVLTFTGKRLVFMNKFFPGVTDYLIKKFYFKNGRLVK